MMVLITYDVSTTSPEGRKRLRLVAKQCINHGQRVQNSVFECMLDPAQLTVLKNKLKEIINEEEDSLRYYNLGSNWKRRVEHIGTKEPYDPEDTMII
ncbi:MAG: CRISPR-associated endonuclease Cas2 [Bacillota bacterium]